MAEAVVRLHPAPVRRATVIGTSGDPGRLQRAAIALARAPLELEGLDVRWSRESGGAVLARAAGAAPEERLPRMASVMDEAGLATAAAQDEQEWDRQRQGQRAAPGETVVRISAVRSDLARVIEASREVGAQVVGRAGLGLFWMRVGAGTDSRTIEGIRRALAPRPCVVLDAPEELRREIDVWGPVEGMDLVRRLKERFDPNGACNPGIFVGGL
jgi:glycolate oxidase FAD binding subunit